MNEQASSGSDTRFLQLRVTVVDAPVPLSRLILIPAHVRLDDTSHVLARLFGHHDTIEFYRFERGDEWFGYPSHFPDRPVTDQRKLALGDLFQATGDIVMYEDEWEFEWRLELRLEGVRSVPDLPGHKVVVLDGEGATPAGVPDVYEYEKYMAGLDDPTSDYHRAAVMTFSPGWDPNRFDRREAQDLVDEVPLPGRRPRFDGDDIKECVRRLGCPGGVDEQILDYALMLAVKLDIEDPARFARVDRVEVMAAAALRAAWLDQERAWFRVENPSPIELAEITALYGVDPAEVEPLVGDLLATESIFREGPAAMLADVERQLLEVLRPVLDLPDPPEPA